MSYIGRPPANAALTSADISDNTITSAKIVNDSIVNADIKSDAAIAQSKLATLSVAEANISGTLGAAKITNTAVTLSDDQTLTGNIRGTITTLSDNTNTFNLTSTSNTNNLKVTFTTGTPTLTFTLDANTVGQSGNIVFINTGATSFSAHSTCKIAAADLTTLATAGTYWMSYLCISTTQVLVTISTKLI
jgi:hypothetical protein